MVADPQGAGNVLLVTERDPVEDPSGGVGYVLCADRAQTGESARVCAVQGAAPHIAVRRPGQADGRVS